MLYEELFKSLAQNQIEFLVAGGFAVNFHQVQRATSDLDLIVHLEPDNLKKFILLVETLGYLPKLPVRASDIADSATRESWIQDKNMTVFSFYNPKLKFETLDLFVKEPKPFAELFKNRLEVKAFGISIPVLGIDDLIEIKEKAGREKDLFDVSQLKKVKQARGN